jgi:3-dehydroquinate synthase
MPVSFEIKADARSYGVIIDPGAAMDFLRAQTSDAVVICDAFFHDRLHDLPCRVLSLTAVETNKTLEAASGLIEAARAAGLTRKGRVIAVGGGIVQDVACFLASVYMRGLSWSYLPTTILGMVDSCIGGKSSINVGGYKNLAGTIHPPDMVLVDPEFAQTLPMEHRSGGLCEAAKIAFARGDAVFDRYLALGASPTMAPADLAAVVEVSLRAKQWFVEIDEFDQKERLTLNFGHTFGHALESATGFAINHGAGVGLGMLCAIEFALESGIIERNERLKLLEAHVLFLLRAVDGLQSDFAKVDMEAFRKAVASDKKHTADRLTLVLPVPAESGPLPLDLCRFARDAETLDRISRAVETVQGKLFA